MGQRLVRVICVLRAFEDSQPVTLDSLAEDLGVSRRTVFRDLEALRLAGFRIDFNHKRRAYRLHVNPTEPEEPSTTDLAELLFQAAATSLPQTTNQRRRAKRAADLLAEGLPPTLKKICMTMRDSVKLTEPASNAIASRPKLDRILDAIGNCRCVLVLSLAPLGKSRTESWVIKPLQIVRDQGRWILEGIILPSSRSLRADLSKIGVESTDREPPLDNWPNGQPLEPGVEIL